MSQSPNAQLKTSWPVLFTSHMEAWGAAMGITFSALLLNDAFNWQGLYLAVSLAAGYWLAFAINDYFDAPYDAQNPRKLGRNYFVENPISPRKGMVLFLLILTPILPPFISSGVRGVFIMILSLVIAWGYSMPPLRFKSRPGLDLIIHVLFVETFPYVVAMTLLDLTWTGFDWAFLMIMAASSFLAQIEQQIRDASTDIFHESTFTTKIGAENAMILLKVGSAAVVLFAGYHVLIGNVPWILVPLPLLVAPIFLHRLIRNADQGRPEKLMQVITACCLIYILIIILYQVWI